MFMREKLNCMLKSDTQKYDLNSCYGQLYHSIEITVILLTCLNFSHFRKVQQLFPAPHTTPLQIF